MKQKHQRLLFLTVACVGIGLTLTVLLNNLEEYIIYFYSPSDIAQRPPASNDVIRAGGMVKPGSVRQEEDILYFTLTDYQHDINVKYSGLVPALFREEQGVVAEGTYRNTMFYANMILAKHDENYMPPEVAKTLKDDQVQTHITQPWKDDAAQTITITE